MIAQIASPSAATSFVSPQFTSFAVEASASQVVGSFPAVDGSAPPAYKQVHQEQIAAEPESLVRNSAPSDICIHVPISQIQEQFVESVKEFPQAVEQRVGIPITAAHAACSPPVTEFVSSPMQESVPAIEHVTCCQFYSACSSDQTRVLCT